MELDWRRLPQGAARTGDFVGWNNLLASVEHVDSSFRNHASQLETWEAAPSGESVEAFLDVVDGDGDGFVYDLAEFVDDVLNYGGSLVDGVDGGGYNFTCEFS